MNQIVRTTPSMPRPMASSPTGLMPLNVSFAGPVQGPTPWTIYGSYINYRNAVTVGAPTGGTQGNGTINAQGLFVNGVAVAVTPIDSGTF